MTKRERERVGSTVATRSSMGDAPPPAESGDVESGHGAPRPEKDPRRVARK